MNEQMSRFQEQAKKVRMNEQYVRRGLHGVAAGGRRPKHVATAEHVTPNAMSCTQ